MQINCHNCRNLLTVNPAGGQFQCPHCGAVNAVGAPIGTPIQHPPHAAAPQAPPKKDNRKTLVGTAFAGLGIMALLIGWWGLALGVALLGWAIAGALGKIKGPLNLVFPQSARKTTLSVLGIVLSSFVTMCGVTGGMAQYNKAKEDAREAKERAEYKAATKALKEKQETEAAAAKAAHEEKLRNGVSVAATAYAAGLDSVEALIADEKWTDADQKMKEVAAAVAEYRKLSPVPDEITALIPRHEALTPKLELKRRERETLAWIERAEAVVSDHAKCEDKSKVDAARKQVEGLKKSDTNYTKVQELNTKLDKCLKNMPPPSEWLYNVRKDPMGGSVATAAVESTNTFNFDFPYHGTQHATLLIRNDKGTDILVLIEKGQFICSMGCSVLVRFDEGTPQRWRAVGPSDHSTESIFLRRESKFLALLKKARVVRIETEFFHEGTRVMEFPVARFDASKLK